MLPTTEKKNSILVAGGGSSTNAYIVESEDFGNLSATPTKILEANNKNFSLGANNNHIYFQRESAVGDFNNDGLLDIMQPQPFDTSNFVYVYQLGPLTTESIILQPQDVSVCENDIAQFVVAASGASSTYQWQESTDGILFTDLSNGGSYSNVTNDTLTINPTANSMNGYMYRCVVSGSLISDAATLSVDLGNYIIPSMDIACSSPTFFVPIEAVSTVSSEVLGLDFCLQYDTAMMTPTGNAVVRDVVHGGNTSYADYFLNTDSAGLINGVIFLTSAAPFPTYFSGNGIVIEIEFTQGNSFIPGAQTEVSLCGVTESTLTSGNIDHCSALSATYSSINDPTFIGTIKFWDKNGKRLTYDTLNPGAFIPTTIVAVDSLCTPTGSTTFLPDLNGEFIYEVSEGDHIQIERDIPGDFSGAGPCTNVMSWINGADQNRAMKIATLDPSFTPNAYQIVAADVNMDGVVNAGDVTLMAARSVMSICGFPSATVEKDWLFIDQIAFDTDPSFVISANYPLDDGMGYSKNNVPAIPDCLPAPLVTTTSCIATMEEDYIAILLGDVSGNWKSVDGANLRTNEPQLTFQFDQLIEQGDHYLVPIVFAETQEVESFDLMLDFDIEHISVEELEMQVDGFVKASNVRENQFLFTSFSLDAVSSSTINMYLKFKTDNVELAADYVDQIAAFINGEKVTTGTTFVLSTQNLVKDWKVYPNPFTENITLEYQREMNAFDLRIINAAGQQVYMRENLTGKNGKVSLDLSDLSSGIYFLQITSEDEMETIRIVK